MDCSEINLKLTKNNFDPHALADYIEKHKDTILANYGDKHLECLDIKLNITNQAITLEQLFKELKVYFKNHLEERFCAYQKSTDLSFGTTINFNKFKPLIPIKDFMNLLNLDNYIGVITYTSATDDKIVVTVSSPTQKPLSRKCKTIQTIGNQKVLVG